MKHLHFYGCSFTAGDELSDDEFFPWKSECKDREEYYYRRSPELAMPNFFENYTEKNKTMAYPAKMNSDEITTYNHARNGSSTRECIFHMMDKLYDADLPQPDAVFLQLPPFPREFYIDGQYRSDYPPANTCLARTSIIFGHHHDDLKTYAKTKLLTHFPYQSAVEDIMDLIMINSFFKLRNIDFYLINFGYELRSRLTIMPIRYRFLIDELFKTVPMIDLVLLHDEAERLLGGHYSESTHEKIAQSIKDFLDKKEKSLQ